MNLNFKAFLLILAMALSPACREKPRFDYDFEQPAIPDQVQWKCGTLLRLSSEHATSGAGSLEVTFYPDSHGDAYFYPGITFTDFDRNWAASRALSFDAFVPGENGIPLELRIDDRDNPDYGDRFASTILLNPGQNHIEIPLTSLITSGSKRSLDPRGIGRVMFFLVNPKESHTIFFDQIHTS